MKKVVLVWITILVIMLSGCVIQPKVPQTFPQPLPLGQLVDDTLCQSNVDCDCGVHINTGDCFFGNKRFVKSGEYCPDFCTGIGGNLRVVCVNNHCTQTQI